VTSERKTRTILLCFIIGALAGCTAAGVKVTEDQARQFERGKSTYTEVVGKLGQPSSSVALANGMRVISYSYVEASARPATFIPIVGPLVGGADARSNVVTFMFDASGVLTNYTAASSQTGSGFGAAANTRVVPVENQPRKEQ
jgi:outer membrane protein assembly factor BamE (lipoprotein component of BamABCDE complex)